MRTQSFSKVLELKKKKVYEVVRRICSIRHIAFPSINFEGCPNEGHELAHYHPDTNTICISERQLVVLNFEDLEAVVAHEVSHILVQDHSPKFRAQEEISGVAGWRPPGGSVHVTSKNSKPVKSKPSKEDKTRCNYHLCRKKAALSQCPHCKGYYCEEHFEPYEPAMKKKRISEKAGHPCVPFAEYLENKKKEDAKKYSEALNKLLKKEKKPKQLSELREYHKDEPIDEVQTEEHEEKKSFFQKLKSWFGF